MNRIFVLDRITERHPDVSKEDAAHALSNVLVGKIRLDKEPTEYVMIGFDSKGRLLEIVAIRNDDGDWLIKHAQTPPQERVKRELGFKERDRR